jgi:hypothetical protein
MCTLICMYLPFKYVRRPAGRGHRAVAEKASGCGWVSERTLLLSHSVCVLFLLDAHACVNLQRQAAAAATTTVNGRQSRFDLLRKVKITLQIFTTYSCKRKFAATCTLPPTTKVESKSWNRIVHRPLCRIASARVAFAALRAVMRARLHHLLSKRFGRISQSMTACGGG